MDMDSLKYPLKLVSEKYAKTHTYEECPNKSFGDPNQGFSGLSWKRLIKERFNAQICAGFYKLLQDRLSYIKNDDKKFEEINYIEKSPSQNKCIIHLTNKDEKFISDTIMKLKQDLGSPFFQTHKSCLVNLDNIKFIDYAKFTIYFKNGESTLLLTPIARKELRKRVGSY